jgi:hypothetical protein
MGVMALVVSHSLQAKKEAASPNRRGRFFMFLYIVATMARDM